MANPKPVLQMWDLGPSPNSKKVRVALGYKGIPHERIAVSPTDRADIVRISGQPLTPIIQHGDVVMFDSSAICRYLEANVQKEPRLFSADYGEMSAIERWEMFARTRLGAGGGPLFGEFFSETRDPEKLLRANESFNAAAQELEAGLDADGWLVGKSMTMGDVACASWIAMSLVTPEQAASSPLLAFFAEHLHLDPARGKVRDWYWSIDRHDPASKG